MWGPQGVRGGRLLRFCQRIGAFLWSDDNLLGPDNAPIGLGFDKGDPQKSNADLMVANRLIESEALGDAEQK